MVLNKWLLLPTGDEVHALYDRRKKAIRKCMRIKRGDALVVKLNQKGKDFDVHLVS